MKTGKSLQRGRLYTLVPFTLIAALLAGCSRLPQEPAADGAKAAASPGAKAAPSPSPVATPEPTEWSLVAATVSILEKAHHTGSIVERCQCGPRNHLVQVYTLHAPLKVDPMPDAFNEISKRYPDIQWREVGEGHVRVTDNSARAGLLKVRVKEFLVVEDRPPQAALSALWKTNEVAAYMARRNVHFARTSSPRSAPGAKRAPAIIHLKNATVQEIMDRILDSYRAPAGSGLRKVWLYRECQRGAETFIEVRVL
jgi:hypothetical protein